MDIKREMCTQFKIIIMEDELRKFLGIQDVGMKYVYAINAYQDGKEGVEFLFEKSEIID